MSKQSTTVGNPTLAQHKLIENQVFYSNKFIQFMSFSKSESLGKMTYYEYMQNGYGIQDFGAINMHTDALKNGGDYMIVPQIKLMPENFRYGEEQLKDHEVEMSINWRHLWVNGVRHGVLDKTGYSSAQRNKQVDEKIRKILQAQLGQKMLSWINYYGLYDAMFKGFSRNITADLTAGISVTPISHPNFYYDVSGTLTKVSHAALPGTSGYEDAVEAACDTYTGAATEVLDHTKVLQLRQAAIDNKIEQIATVDGEHFWVCMIHPKIADQLRSISEFRTWQSRAMEKGAKNPCFSGALGFYEGILFVEDPAIPSVDHEGGTLVYGTTQPTINRDTRDFALGILLGKNAISGAKPLGIQFADREDDYGALTGLGASMYLGFARNDYFADINSNTKGTLGDFQENTSSLVFIMNKAA